MRFLVIIEPTGTGFTARVPDLEGCVASGRTREQVERQIRAVIEFHFAELRARGAEPPRPSALPVVVEVLAPVASG